jgi:FkbM family methyltransferase
VKSKSRIIGDWGYSNLSENFILKIKSIFSKEARRKYKGYKSLKDYPRYMNGKMTSLKPNFNFVDSDSALFMYDEIFGNDVYKFVSNSDSPLVLDCGANIGLSTIYFKQLYPNARVISFEPDNQIFEVLESNVKGLHKLNDVTLINAALWTHLEGINFASDGADAGKISTEDTNVYVRTCKLSNYLDSRIDYLKMDIEGAEYDVLQECGEKLKNVHQMFIEYHSFEHKTQNLHRILELLSGLNFRYYLTMPGLKSSNPLIKLKMYAGMDMQINIYAKNLS